MPPKHPCRLSVFLARAARTAVILRRGPSEWARLSVWNRDEDSFRHGQWFHGRVYGRRCDLSPDGRLFVYFAAKHGRPPDEGVGDAWTAICRPPYFTALTLWPNIGSWFGGGVFRSNREVELDATCTLEPHPSSKPVKIRVAALRFETAPWEQRLLMGGWTLEERGFDPRSHRRVGQREAWCRPFMDVTLYREVEDWDPNRYGGPYSDTYWLQTDSDVHPLDRVTWADVDETDRLVMVRDGVLLEARWADGRLTERVLEDFNPARPEEISTPDWATKW